MIDMVMMSLQRLGSFKSEWSGPGGLDWSERPVERSYIVINIQL